ncbi:MAG: hypothetical protein IKQ20_12160 [Bacteroidales bacterium]|nr:hypothetical protein [Bacteroidales bacterium]
MTEFDKLLKAKAEQAEYPYRASAWRQFCRRAGIRALTGGQIAAIAVSGTAVAGLVVWGVASHIGRQPAAEPEPVEVAIVAPDTTAIVPEDTFVVEEIQPAAVPAKPAPVVQREMPAAKPEEVKTSVVEKPAQAKPEPFRGRPVIINVDTVKDNVPSDEELRKRNSQIIVE